MQRHYDFDVLHRDIARALEKTLARHGIDSLYSPLAVAAVLEAVASPLKLQQTATPLTGRMGRAGTEAYLASRLPRAVELLKSPHSRIVNPMMDAIAAAIHRRRAPAPDAVLRRDALRILLARPRLSDRGAERALADDASLAPAFLSARSYLEEGSLIARTEDGAAWRLTDPWNWP
jgi:hypothetical protein